MIIIKLLAKKLSFLVMRDRLKAIWRLSGGFEMVGVGYGFYMVKFDLAQERVSSGKGPWMSFDHYLVVRPWVINFVAFEVKIDSTMVWIHFSSLGLEYYDESILLALAAAVGQLVRMDF